MRIRSIKPEFWDSEDIAMLDWETRFVFIGLWSYVDDNGVGRDNEKLIRADLFPLEDDPRETLARLSRALQQLSEAGRITRYRVGDREFLHISNWKKHQRIDRPNKARYPDPTCEDIEIREGVARQSRHPREDSLSGAVEQGNRGTGEGEQHASRAAASEADEPPPDDDYVPTEIENAARPQKPQKASSTELSFIRLHIGQQLPRPVEQSLINEVRRLRSYDTPVIEEALRMWAGRPDARPGLLPHLVTDVLKRPHAKPQGGESKADIWTTSVIDPADQAATDQQRKLA